MGLSTITPETRSEEFIDRIARALGSGGTSPLDTITPETRHEEFIDRIARANGWTDVSPLATIYPETRLEEFLNRIADNAGGGSVEMENGVYEPDADIYQPTINFSESHDAAPAIVLMYDYVTDIKYPTSGYFSIMFIVVNYEKLGTTYLNTADSPLYGYMGYTEIGNGAYAKNNYTITSLTGNTSSSMPYWVDAEKFKPRTSTNGLWHAGRTYKWVALWL